MNRKNSSHRLNRARAMFGEGSSPVIRAEADRAEILLYGVIGGGFFGDGPSTEEIVRDISEIEADEILVRINSPGGVVWDGIAIYNALINHPAKVTTQVDGLAASIASVVAMAGDEVVMLRGTMFMIHKPSMFSLGNSDDLRKDADLLDTFEERIVDVYKTKTDMTPKALSDAMKAETWYSPEQAKDAGFVDRIADGKPVENRFNLTDIFDNVPDELRPEPTVRDVERILRDGGVSRSTAERIAALANGSAKPQGEPERQGQGEPDSESIRRALDALRQLKR